MKRIEPKHGDGTIRIVVGFNARLKGGKMKRRHAQQSGWLWFARSKYHGINGTQKSMHFKARSKLQMAAQIVQRLDELLELHNITLQ